MEPCFSCFQKLEQVPDMAESEIMSEKAFCPACKRPAEMPVAEYDGWVRRKGSINTRHVFLSYADPSGQFFAICHDYGTTIRGWGDTPKKAAEDLRMRLENQ
jgi:hypothetical protein